MSCLLPPLYTPSPVSPVSRTATKVHQRHATWPGDGRIPKWIPRIIPARSKGLPVSFKRAFDGFWGLPDYGLIILNFFWMLPFWWSWHLVECWDTATIMPAGVTPPPPFFLKPKVLRNPWVTCWWINIPPSHFTSLQPFSNIKIKPIYLRPLLFLQPMVINASHCNP